MTTPRNVFTTARRTRRFGIALLCVGFAAGCDNNSVRGSAPTVSPAPIVPSPSPVPPQQRTLTLFGMAYEVSATGCAPVADVLIEEMTCDSANPGCGVNTVQHTTTDRDGMYRLTGLYAGGNNFVWITKDGYEPVGRPAVATCDYCNQIVEMNGDTRLDIELARR